MKKETLLILTMIAIFLFVLAIIPIALIWSINTLFSLSIAYTWTNWLAGLVLLILMGNGAGATFKRKENKYYKENKCCKEK